MFCCRQISKCGGSPIVSCMTSIGHLLLFLGSWLGDSLLVQFTEVLTHKSNDLENKTAKASV